MIGGLLAVCLLLAEPVPVPTGTESAPPARTGTETVLAFADDLLLHGEPERAIPEYSRFLFLCGDCARAPYAAIRLAEAFRRAGDPAQAAAQEKALVSRWPQAPEAREAALSVGDDLEKAGDERASSDAYREFAAAHPGDPASGEQIRDAVRAALRGHDAGRVALAVPLAGPELVGLPAELAHTKARHRSPVVAGILAAILPGAGHAYAGEWTNALTAFATNGLFIGGAVIAAQRKEYAIAGVVGGFELFWYGGNVIGAVNAAGRYDVRAEDARWKGVETRWLPPTALSFRF